MVTNRKTTKTPVIISPTEQKIYFEFDKINYSLKRGEKKHILKGCSGRVIPGRFLAIIGSSGAGKSSLLNILAGRLRTSKKYSVTGEIKLNGSADYSLEAFTQNTAYVMQQNPVFETLTAREIFDLSASLRLPGDIKAEERDKLVESNIQILSLEKCADSLVGGDQIRGISGGERKRVSIGNELITNPTLFFADEPTSGLDSFNAIKVVDLLLKVAHSGKTVIATLHQPSSTMFKKFDDLLVLSDGRVLYNGPADEAVAFFSSIGYEIPLNNNPADFFMEVSEVKCKEDAERIQKISEEFEKVVSKREVDPGVKRFVLEEKIKNEPSFLLKAWYLLKKRVIKNYFRMPSTSYIRAIQSIFFAVLIGILFLRVDENDVASRMSVLFFVVASTTSNSVTNVILVFPSEKVVLKHELSNGMYNVLSYCLSKFLVEIFFNFFNVLLFVVIMYWMVGLKNNAEDFFKFYLASMTCGQIGYSLGTLVSILAGSQDSATNLSSFMLLPLILLSGFFITVEKMNVVIRWIPDINFFRYSLDMLLCTQLREAYPEDKYWRNFGIQLGFFAGFLTLSVCLLIFTTRKVHGGPLRVSEKTK